MVATTGAVSPWRRMRKAWRSRGAQEARTAYTLLLVPMGLLGVFHAFPFVLSVLVSLIYWNPNKWYFVGLDNYVHVLKDSVFWLAMRNAAVYSLLAMPVGLIFSLLVASLIARMASDALRSLFRGGFYLPGVVSGVVMSAVWLWILSPSSGAINGVLSLFGIDSINWLGNYKTALFALVLMYWLTSHGGAIVILSAAITNIPKDYYESSRLDGARWRDELLHITIPLIRPALLYEIVSGTIGTFQVFTPVYIMTRGGPANSTMTISFLIYQTGFDQFDFGRATAQTILMAAVVLALAIIQLKFLSVDVEY